MEPRLRKTECAFVVLKFRAQECDYYLLRKDPDWDDYGLVGGHLEVRDRGSFLRGARRELAEEVRSIGRSPNISLKKLTAPLKYGPVYSKSAKVMSEYKVQFFLLVFGSQPRGIVQALKRGRGNVLVSEHRLLELLTQGGVSAFVRLLADELPAGLVGIQSSWGQDICPLLKAGNVKPGAGSQMKFGFQ